MKIFVIGSGGREHALVWKIAQSNKVDKIWCASGNVGIEGLAECVDIKMDDIPELVDFAKSHSVDMVVVGPEVPLVEGIVDRLKFAGIKAFGPSKAAAIIEASKKFMKDFCQRHGIPTASYAVFSEASEAKRYVKNQKVPIVIKADGLAAGKGVIICNDISSAIDAVDDIMSNLCFGASGSSIVVEDFLYGEEASFMAICDGKNVLPLVGSQDHKRAHDGDDGPNTGGMGAVSPVRILDDKIVQKVMDRIMLPTVRGMSSEGRSFIGVLYAGLMIKNGEPMVLEFNARFGDPETQALMMRMKTDIVDIMEAAVSENLDKVSISWDNRSSACVVLASGGYPHKYEKGKIIHGLEESASISDVCVFHAGTIRNGDDIVTNGGRVLGVTALGDDMRSAIDKAYSAAKLISWDDMFFRNDIGFRNL